MNQSIPENFDVANCPPEIFLPHHHPEFRLQTCITNTFLNTIHSRSNTYSAPLESIVTDRGNVRSNKRKAMEQSTSCLQNTSPVVSSTSDSEGNTRNNGRRGRSTGKNSEKSSEVVHVRAKRGQATDSHRIAERIRREKINEKMKCLQDLVPGCHNAKGMALMLDEIINYVHSLQSQVEFLSMELAAACSSYDLKTQETNTQVAQGMEKWGRGRYGEHSTWPF